MCNNFLVRIFFGGGDDTLYAKTLHYKNYYNSEILTDYKIFFVSLRPISREHSHAMP